MGVLQYLGNRSKNYIFLLCSSEFYFLRRRKPSGCRNRACSTPCCQLDVLPLPQCTWITTRRRIREGHYDGWVDDGDRTRASGRISRWLSAWHMVRLYLAWKLCGLSLCPLVTKGTHAPAMSVMDWKIGITAAELRPHLPFEFTGVIYNRAHWLYLLSTLGGIGFYKKGNFRNKEENSIRQR